MKADQQIANFIIGKRKRAVLLAAVSGVLICMGITVRLLLLYLNLPSNESNGDAYLLICCIILFSGLGIVTLIQYIRMSPTVKIDEKCITVGKQVLFWIDVESISLNGEHRSWFGYTRAAIVLYLPGDKVKYVYDSMYSNYWELKFFISKFILQQALSSKSGYQQIDQSEISKESYSIFVDNQLLSLRGIIMWLPTTFFIYMFLFVRIDPSVSGHITLLLTTIFIVGSVSQSMNYFKLSPRFLIIKKQNLFWIQQVYILSDIQEAIIQEDGRKLKYLRIITKDFQSKNYAASSLWDETWLKLKDKLDEYGVNVRNDCIDTNPIY